MTFVQVPLESEIYRGNSLTYFDQILSNDVNNEFFLINRTNSIVPAKNFFHERRSERDIKKFVNKLSVNLEEESAFLHTITSNIVSQIISDHEVPNLSYINDVRSKLFNNTYSLSSRDSMEFINLKNLISSASLREGTLFIDPECLTLYCELPTLKESYVGLSKLTSPTNFGPSLEVLRFVCLVLGPTTNQKAFDIARMFSTILSFSPLRLELKAAKTKDDFKSLILKNTNDIVENLKQNNKTPSLIKDQTINKWKPIVCIKDDFCRRFEHYYSDYVISDFGTVKKCLSASTYLFITIIVTNIALGMLNESNTEGKITVRHQILSQIIGSLIFGVIGGQFFLVMLSTAPISIYTNLIHNIALKYGYDFFSLYSATGLFCCLYLIVLALAQASIVMKVSKRSLEELFGMFISLALIIKACQAALGAMNNYGPHCLATQLNVDLCERASGIFFLLIMISTFLLSLWLRNLIRDYSLPVAVLIITGLSCSYFKDIPREHFTYDENEVDLLHIFQLNLPKKGYLIAAILAIPLAILFFIDQYLVTKTVDNKETNLKNGSSFDYDLLIVAVINIFLSICGLPLMHGALPHSFLHVQSLSDGDGNTIVKTRESRIPILLAHLLMIPTFLYLLPYFQLYIPVAVFHGVFLNMAFTSSIGLQFFERLQLLITKQQAYPPTHYIRKVPQREIHYFTLVELFQLIILVGVGFSGNDFVEICFPLLIFSFIPIRAFVLPMMFPKRHLQILDDDT
uniref:Bicarbonate transporter-like transmembrane domain-containing protein n=1 Tax=Rhabditophanes sp. KR3021 TaxID=114890 RepID=A0AC35TLH5_9BILA